MTSVYQTFLAENTSLHLKTLMKVGKAKTTKKTSIKEKIMQQHDLRTKRVGIEAT